MHLICMVVKVHPRYFGCMEALRAFLRLPLPQYPAALAQRLWELALFFYPISEYTQSTET